jgi:hypothetical protein
LIQLANGAVVTVAIDYQGSTPAETVLVNVSNLVSATNPMPPVGTPANVAGGFQVADLGQDGTGQLYEQGFVHLAVIAPPGVVFASATFGQIVWGLSDEAGLAWDSTAATLGHNHVYPTLRPGTSDVADLYFAPERDEAPAAGSTSPTMLLRVAIPNENVYVTPFAGADWDLSAKTDALDAQAAPIPPTTEAELRSDLKSTTPEYDTIDLPANATIVITQPLAITHSVQIIGNNATLLFQQGDTAPWPATASGAIYVDAPAYTNIQVKLYDFTIRFDMGAPLRWSNPAGAGPALFDPENDPSGIAHAVIDTRDSNTNLNMTLFSLSGMTILGPPAFDGAAFQALAAQLPHDGLAAYQYVGEQDMDLIRTNDLDTGTIAASTFHGGPIELVGGPWNITGNTVLGATADTYSPGAFELHSPHDLYLEGNHVSQADPAGREFRLLVLAYSGFDDMVEDNSFGGGAGQVGNELGYSAQTGGFGGVNDPEVILAESTYGVLFEGRPGAISADGRLIVLPDLRAPAFAGATGPGLVVSILASVNAAGSSSTHSAGQWFQVAQQVSLGADNTIELLMEKPLPPAPPGGYYEIEVTGGFVNNAFLGNTIDLAGKSSTGIVLNGEDYGSQIVGNAFVGGSTYDNVYTGTAIVLAAAIASAPAGSGAFPLPAGWTALPDLGTIVEKNTIRDSLGGMIIGVQHAVNYWEARVGSTSETGRVVLTASVSGNLFEFDAAFLSAWAASCAADGNNPAENSTPPTVTIGSGWSAEAPGPYGSPRFPWTVGNAMTENGSDTPIFVDPIENVVSLRANTVDDISAGGTITPASGWSGQVFAAIVNGATDAPTLAPQVYNGAPYYAFNLDNLDIAPAIAPPPPRPTPGPPPAPTGLSAALNGLNQVVLAWSASSGASSYVVQRNAGASTWTVIAAGITATSFSDPDLGYSTTYAYRVVAVSSAGWSDPSAVLVVQTLAQPDVLTAVPLTLILKPRVAFTGPVATFTDANASTGPARFVATIHWGDRKTTLGTVEGGDGAFTVIGTHRYAKAGIFVVNVTVTLTASDPAGASVDSLAEVSIPAKHHARVRAARRLATKTLQSPTGHKHRR